MSRIANSNPSMAMNAGNPLANSEKQFLQQVARQRVTTYDGNTWEYYDCGKQSTSGRNSTMQLPLVCLPGTSGSARCFHLQMQTLAAKGYRVLAVQHPPVWTHDEWVHSFDRFLNALHLREIHVYGVSLGAYLAQGLSLNYVALCRNILENFPKESQRSLACVHAIDYMVDQVDKLSQKEVASRLTLNCLPCNPNAWTLSLPDEKITVIDSHDETSQPRQVRDQLLARYPNAKRAMLKNVGDFPFLSHPDDVAMHLQ
uniref:Maspardin n=1 Tax=Globisporangium ultimum (strain ATCC 200006 / CBS 805.95 / DAOM BR144) TaxID=431595 RepID=K3WHT2_GLOUD